MNDDDFTMGTGATSLDDMWQAVKAEVDARSDAERVHRVISPLAHDAMCLALIASLYFVLTFLETMPCM